MISFRFKLLGKIAIESGVFKVDREVTKNIKQFRSHVEKAVK